MPLAAPDLAILLVYLVTVVLLGLWAGRRPRTASDYMLGGRNLPWWLILFSVVATETSTVTFLSIPGFAFAQDLTWLQLPCGYVIGRLLVAGLLIPRYFRGELFTAYEVLGDRFGSTTQRAASWLFIITRSLADGLRLFLSAIVLQELTGLAMAWAVVAIGATTILYTFFGGMRAVLWTDLVQFAVYTAGAGLALALILQRLPGGWHQVLRVGEAAGKLRVIDLGWAWDSPYTLWAGLLGGIFLSLGSHGVDQMMVQRYLCARSASAAQRAVSLSGIVVLVQFALFLIIGTALFAFYQAFPPAAAFERPDRVFAAFIVDEIPVGVRGLLLGAIFAAAMSTLSSSLNACATAAARDLGTAEVAPTRAGSATDQQSLRKLRALTLLFGVVQIVVGVGAQRLQGSVISSVLGIAGLTTGIVLGLFLLGMLTTRVEQPEALIGGASGLVIVLGLFFATPLAWPWFAVVGSVGTFAAGWAASFVLPRQDPKPAHN